MTFERSEVQGKCAFNEVVEEEVVDEVEEEVLAIVDEVVVEVVTRIEAMTLGLRRELLSLVSTFILVKTISLSKPQTNRCRILMLQFIWRTSNKLGKLTKF